MTFKWGPQGNNDNANDTIFPSNFKSERLGKVADWIGAEARSKGKGMSDSNEGESGSFLMVEGRNSHSQKKVYRPQNKVASKDRERRTGQTAKSAFLKKKWNSYRQGDKKDKKYIQIDEKWKLVETFEINRLTKLHADYSEPTVMKDIGRVGFYDLTLDKITSKSERILERSTRKLKRVPIEKDPIIEAAIHGKDDIIVVASDLVLCTLMGATRSVLPWDIIIRKSNDRVFLEYRDDSIIDCVTAIEKLTNSPDIAVDPVNNPLSLIDEATSLNLGFMDLSTKSSKNFELGEECQEDWLDDSKFLSLGYRYREWNIEGNIKLLGRVQVDAVIESVDNESSILASIKCLNEIDSKVSGIDYRKKADNQKSAILATEFSNNANKIIKWTFQALIGDIDVIKVGFAARANPKESTKHYLLGTNSYVPSELAKQMGIDMRNGWGVVKTFVKFFASLEDGHYVLCKDPDLTKPALRLYRDDKV